MSGILINIKQGILRGTTGIDIDGNLYYAFLGIPYAKSPIGKLRFKEPQPLENWSGIRDARKNGSACYSREFVTRTIVGSEDCLFLNVFTPKLPNKERTNLKSVMVYIHGGAFIAGSNDSGMYGPEFLITEDVVLVVINYRTGLLGKPDLGFLAFEDSKFEVPGNAGCKDMIMALKWVQSNITEFGGDPNKITIFGESAGGAAVHFLILSQLSKDLFHRAIIQSGSVLNPWSLAKPSAIDLARALNCPYTKDEEILTYLQDLPVEKILEGQDKLSDKFQANFVRSFGPVVEKGIPNKSTFLSDCPLNLIQQGKYNHVPMIIGYTAKEGIFFEMLEKKWNQGFLIEDFETVVPHWFNLERGSDMSRTIANKIKQFYISDNSSYPENKEEMCLVHSDACFIRSIYDSVRNHVISSKEPIYFYKFSVDANLNFYKKFGNLELSGASHADDLGYLFKTFLTPNELNPNSVELKSVRRMVKFWTNFAKTGDPNPVENIIWKPATKDEINFLDIDEELKSDVNPDEDRMKFWDEVYDMVQNC